MGRIALTVVLVGAVLAAPPSGAVAKVRGPLLLIGLPDIGTVTWRCDPARSPGLALGFRAAPASATEQLRLIVAGHTVVTRVLQPGERLRLPYLRARSQRIMITQFSEAGTLRASVEVEFVPHPVVAYCYSYAPPRIDVHVSPRS